MLALLLAIAAADPAATAAQMAALDHDIAARRAAIAQAHRPLDTLAATIADLAARPAIRAGLDPAGGATLAHARALYGALQPLVERQTRPLEQAIVADQAARRTTLTEARDAERRAFARQQEHDAAATARLAALPGPLFRPDVRAAPCPAGLLYRLPAGRLLNGGGERLDSGVQARGLGFATAPGARIVAPAPGWVAFAGRFRGYGNVVILDHGHGWASVLAGLATVTAASGRLAPAGAPLGTMSLADPRVTIELRHAGRPADAAAIATTTCGAG